MIRVGFSRVKGKVDKPKKGAGVDEYYRNFGSESEGVRERSRKKRTCWPTKLVTEEDQVVNTEGKGETQYS